MSEAAHPQREGADDARAKKLHAANGPRSEDHDEAWSEAPEALREMYREMAGSEPARNPFPSTMTVPGPDGEDAVVELAVVDGVVYAPMLDQLPLTPAVRQYVTQYCAAWSASVLTSGKLDAQWPAPPRRAQLVFQESQLHAMLGLAPDERLVRTVVEELTGAVHFVVESPRLPVPEHRDGQPPYITLPVAAWYEGRQA
jgi:hypothetical protein